MRFIYLAVTASTVAFGAMAHDYRQAAANPSDVMQHWLSNGDHLLGLLLPLMVLLILPCLRRRA